MRTTLTLDDDVAAVIEAERSRTGESFRETVNRLIRISARRGGGPTGSPPALLKFSGSPQVDVTDISDIVADLDDEHFLERGLR